MSLRDLILIVLLTVVATSSMSGKLVADQPELTSLFDTADRVIPVAGHELKARTLVRE